MGLHPLSGIYSIYVLLIVLLGLWDIHAVQGPVERYARFRGDIPKEIVTKAPKPRTTTASECGMTPADIVFLLDSSRSIWREDFTQQLKFVKNVVSSFSIAKKKIQVSVIIFSSQPQVQFYLNEYHTTADVVNAIGKIRQRPGETYTGDALITMRRDVFSKRNGARPDARKIGIVITDGLSTLPLETDKAASDAKKAGIKMFAIGVGEHADFFEIKRIASKPENVFTVEGYGALYKIRDELTRRTCSVLNDPAATSGTNPPPVHGTWSTWEPWSTCTLTCGAGTQLRMRVCNNPAPANFGKDCPGLKAEFRGCNIKNCPVAGSWSHWSPWSTCSKSCEGGTKTRYRMCNDPPPKHGGPKCKGDEEEVSSCNLQPCSMPIDGAWSTWAGWSSCSSSCGGGFKRRFRYCNSPEPAEGGKDCEGLDEDIVPCKERECPVNGGWSDWKQTECSVSCGGGVAVKTRTCTAPEPSNGGEDCKGKEKENVPCNSQECPIDGKWDIWTTWSTCTKSCEGGKKSRKRTCSPPQHGGKPCDGADEETVSCNTHLCPVDGYWSSWSAWTSCSATCGNGKMTKMRVCLPPVNGGLPCPEGKHDTVKQSCKNKECPVDGEWSGWTSWSKCSVPCGGGKQTRERTCDKPAPSHGGQDCAGDMEQSQECNKKACQDEANPEEVKCGENPTDVIFVVDASSSIWPEDFKKLRNFLRDVVAEFNIGTDKTQVALMLFSDRPRDQFYLNTYSNKDYLLRHMVSVRQIGGGTRTDKALQKVMTGRFLKQQFGARDNAKKVVIVISDGHSLYQEKTSAAAAELKKFSSSPPMILAVGIGGRVNFRELYSIATSPVHSHVFRALDYNSLGQIKEMVAKKACEGTR